MKRYQTGATLIIVLIFLILIISVGAIAVRQSVTDLKVATSDQVDTLLLNASDSVPSDLEQYVNAGGTEYTQLIGAAGPFGYFMNALGDTTRGDQLVFCYNPRSETFFSFDKATVLEPASKGGGVKRVQGSDDNVGYCDVTNKSNYTNARNTTMVQTVITRPDEVTTPAPVFGAMPIGRDVSVDNPNASNPLFEIYSTSVLPALSDANASSINECLKKPNKDASRFVSGKDDDDNDVAFAQTLSECLEAERVPHKPLVEQVRMTNVEESDICIDHGKAGTSITQACRDKYKLKADGTPKPAP